MFKISKDKTPIDFFQGDIQIHTLKRRALTYNEVADLLNQYNVTKRGKNGQVIVSETCTNHMIK